LSIPLRGLTTSKHWLRTQNPTEEIRKAARDLLLAETSVSKALSLAQDSPSPASNPWFHSLPVELIPPNKPTFFTDREKAQTWYALGTVHMALGEYIFACGDMERALELWGKDTGIDEEGGLRSKIEESFEKARKGIDGDAESMWVGEVRPGTGLKTAASLAKELSDDLKK
jgi:tetratricopeptide (TPR) repeat protein